MKKKGKDDIEKDFESDDELYASYDAYKTLLDAGVSKTDALKRTGLTAQIVKDLEAEEGDEEGDDNRDDLKDAWYSNEDEDEGGEWKEDDGYGGDDTDWDDSGDISEDMDSDWDDKY